MNRFGDIDISFKRLPPVYGYRSENVVSLEKALESVESQIDELPHYIKTAKKYCHFPSEHGLSRNQSAAVFIYTMEWGDQSLYNVLNKALRSEDRRALTIWFPYLKLFDTALDMLPTLKEILWRGVPLDIGKNFTENQIVTWWSISSCSLKVDVIKNFFGNTKNSTLFLIQAVNGKKLSGYTVYEKEDEVILRMGTQFRVKGKPLEQSKGSYIVHLVEIDDSSVPLRGSWIDIHPNAKWQQNGRTVAGENGRGSGSNQLSNPCGLYVDDDQTVYVADPLNHRIVKWKRGATSGKVVAGGNGEGSGAHQLSKPADVIFDKERDSLIICDWSNNRVVRWPHRNATRGETIISNISCVGLTMDDNGSLYVTDEGKDEVRRYRRGESEVTVVAGGNGRGNRLDQLSSPRYVFVDRDHSVYVSDPGNDRVMKWVRGAKEGIVVAGGQGQGNSLTQLYYPRGVVVDQLGTVYVAEDGNHRITRWVKGATQGSVIVGGNGGGGQSNQLNVPIGLSFDWHGNLYVVDAGNDRVQKFNIDSNS